jgi:hypothetical protein
MKLEGLKQLVKEELKRVLNEEESEFDYEKALQARMNQPSFLEDLELGAAYEVEYRARNMYGEKEIDKMTISITQDDLDKYGGNKSIQNYLTDIINTHPETGEFLDIGYTVTGVKSVKKL